VRNNRILVVYNMCGIRRENIGFYKLAINSVLEQNFEGMQIVLSMYKSSVHCKKELAKEFGNKISYVFYDHTDMLGVNATFNKTVRICVEKYGDFDGYLYLDSGIILTDFTSDEHTKIIQKSYDAFMSGPYSMISLQVDDDSGFHHLGMKNTSTVSQVSGEHYVIPLGKAVNLHSQIFSHEIYETFEGKILPDVFAAYCSESVLSFFNSCIHKKWILMKDVVVRHLPSLEGSSASFLHQSPKHDNPWNNLLHDRDALDFINDDGAINAGLGYEECNGIMMHKEDAYDENGNSLDPKELKKYIKKYFFLSKQELDYNDVEYNAIFR